MPLGDVDLDPPADLAVAALVADRGRRRTGQAGGDGDDETAARSPSSHSSVRGFALLPGIRSSAEDAWVAALEIADGVVVAVRSVLNPTS
jgi:hypothetical protein